MTGGAAAVTLIYLTSRYGRGVHPWMRT